MDNAEAAKLREWFLNYSNKLRMEFGMAMALHGFNEDIIVDVQQLVARNMIDWMQAKPS